MLRFPLWLAALVLLVPLSGARAQEPPRLAFSMRRDYRAAGG